MKGGVIKLIDFKTLAGICAGLLTLAGQAQEYSIDWSTIDGGGGVSSSSGFSVSGTIGQPDAGLLSGGGFRLTGGFWGMSAPVPLPSLSIGYALPNSLVVFWALPTENCMLQVTGDVADPNSWTDISPPYETDGAVMYFQSSLAGNQLFSLKRTTLP